MNPYDEDDDIMPVFSRASMDGSSQQTNQGFGFGSSSMTGNAQVYGGTGSGTIPPATNNFNMYHQTPSSFNHPQAATAVLDEFIFTGNSSGRTSLDNQQVPAQQQQPVEIDIASHVQQHDTTLVSAPTAGIGKKIKNKLRRKKKGGKVRFDDETNEDEDNDDSSSEEEISLQQEDEGHGAHHNHPNLHVNIEHNQPQQKAQQIHTAHDHSQKGFTEVVLEPPKQPLAGVSTTEHSPDQSKKNPKPPSPVSEEGPMKNLMKGDTPHWLFLLAFVLPTIVICSILGIVQLSLCGVFFKYINNDPGYLKDPNALTWQHNCTLLDVRVDCGERGKYLNRGEHCYFEVQFQSLQNYSNGIAPLFNMTSYLPYSLIDNSVYSTMRNGDVVICYTDKKEANVNIFEPQSPLYDAYYMAGGVLGVFGSISVAAALCVIPTAFVRPKNRIY